MAPSTPAAAAELHRTFHRGGRSFPWHEVVRIFGVMGLVVMSLAFASLWLDAVGLRVGDDLWRFYAFSAQPREHATSLHRTEWYPSGTTALDGGVRGMLGDHGEGKRDGAWREWYPDGTLRFDASYIAGKLEGRVQMFAADGRLAESIDYRNGVRDGEERQFHENGVLARAATYRDGLLVGTISTFNEQGALVYAAERP
jgi:hypothetical protein